MTQKLSEDEIHKRHIEFWNADRTKMENHKELKSGYFDSDVLLSVVNGLLEDLRICDSTDGCEHGLEVILMLCNESFINPKTCSYVMSDGNVGTLGQAHIDARKFIFSEDVSLVGSLVDELIVQVIKKEFPFYSPKFTELNGKTFISVFSFEKNGETIRDCFICSSAFDLLERVLKVMIGEQERWHMFEENDGIYLDFEQELFKMTTAVEIQLAFNKVIETIDTRNTILKSSFPNELSMSFVEVKDISTPHRIAIY